MQKDKKILIVIPSLTLGGAEKQALEYALALKKNDKEPVILGIGREGDLVSKLKDHQIKYFTYSFSSFFSGNETQQLFFLIRFIFFLRKYRFNSVITFTYWPNVVFKLIYRLAGIKTMYWNQRSVDDRLKPLFWERLGRKNKANYIANSHASALSISKRHDLKLENVKIIYNVMDLNKDLPLKKVEKTTLDIIMVANFFEEKDQFTLIKAFALLKKQIHLPLKLHLVGNAPGKGKRLMEAKALVFDLGLTKEDVHFYGTHSSVKELLYEMDIAVLSTYSEGYSNAIMEYMDAALPVVATNIPANREALGEDNEEWLFEIEDEVMLASFIKRMIENTDLRLNIGTENYKRSSDLFNRTRLKKELKFLK